MAKCPVCGAPMEQETCGYCGYVERVQPRPAACENNGMPFPGVSMEKRQPELAINQYPPDPGIIPGISRRKRMTAFFLCVFLGGLGVHRFYVGKGGTGVLYLFTFGLFGIGWIVDIILIALGWFQDEFGLPLRD